MKQPIQSTTVRKTASLSARNRESFWFDGFLETVEASDSDQTFPRRLPFFGLNCERIYYYPAAQNRLHGRLSSQLLGRSPLILYCMHVTPQPHLSPRAASTPADPADAVFALWPVLERARPLLRAKGIAARNRSTRPTLSARASCKGVAWSGLGVGLLLTLALALTHAGAWPAKRARRPPRPPRCSAVPPSPPCAREPARHEG